MEANPQPAEGFCGIEIKGNVYTEKQEAGEAILAICKDAKVTDPVPIGSYRASRWSFPSIASIVSLTLF